MHGLLVYSFFLFLTFSVPLSFRHFRYFRCRSLCDELPTTGALRHGLPPSTSSSAGGQLTDYLITSRLGPTASTCGRDVEGRPILAFDRDLATESPLTDTTQGASSSGLTCQLKYAELEI
ncbi:unnamed protein product, partial [Protopolystoma xenopodis]